MTEKKYVTWHDVDRFVYNVTYEYPNITGVYGLPRGGLTLAVMISHRLDVPMLASPCKGCLIVDDICDSGESLLHFVNNSSDPDASNDYIIATMYYKENKLNIVPDYYQYEKGDKWIVFPWECLSTIN